MQGVIDKHLMCSRNDLKDCSYVWRINNIQFFVGSLDGEKIVESAFSTDKIKICLQITKFQNFNTHNIIYLSVICPECPSGQLINFNVNIVDSSGNQIHSTNVQTLTQNSGSRFLLLNMEDLCSSEDIIIICKWQYQDFDKSQMFKVSEHQLGNQLAQTFENHKFYDITFSVSGKKMHAHKLILAARSSVFQKMFEDSTEENIIINDVIPEVFEEILCFVYTGNVPVEKISNQLLEAATNYGLMRLKAICAKQLCLKLSIENVCDLVLLADKHKIVDLKRRCINFINVFSNEVMKTGQWQLMIQTSPDLFNNICKHVLVEHKFWKGIHTSILNKLPNFFVDSCFANSYANTTTFNYQWTIKNFSYYTKVKNFQSPIFCNRSYMNISIDDYVCLGLTHETNPRLTQCKFLILNHNEDIVNKDFEKICQFSAWQGNIEQFIKTDFLLDETNGFISNDTVTIICQGTVLFDCEPLTTNQILSSELKIPNCDLGSELSLLLKNYKFSDVTLIVCGKEFHAHKLLLSARSPVFQAMFEHDMEESRLGKVVITDINHEVFEEMLNYIYTGSISNIDQIAIDLLCSADKYALEELRLICQQHLCNNLSLNNVIETLIFTETFNFKEIKASAMNFISKNAKMVTETNDWESMVKTHPSLLVEIFKTAIE